MQATKSIQNPFTSPNWKRAAKWDYQAERQVLEYAAEYRGFAMYVDATNGEKISWNVSDDGGTERAGTFPRSCKERRGVRNVMQHCIDLIDELWGTALR